MRTRRLVLVASTIAAMVAAGCGGSSGGSSSSKQAGGPAPVGPVVNGATFTYAISSDPGNLDPALNLLGPAAELFNYAYDTLVNTNASGHIVSGLAERWSVTPTLARFTLRQGVTCADGSPVTASTIAQNFDRLKDPKVRSPRMALAMSTPAYQVTADDATRTVTVRFAQPVGFFARTVQMMPVVCGKGLKNPASLATTTSGTGPYVLSEAVANDHYTLTRRQGYAWGPAGATNSADGMPARVLLKVVPNQTTAANLLLTGQVSAARLDGPDAERLTARGVASQSKPVSSTTLLYNQSKGHATADPVVRKALTMAINRSDVAHVVSAEGKVSASMLAPEPNPCSDPSTGSSIPSFDSAGAAALLDQAGWKRGADGVRVKGGKRLSVVALNTPSVGPTMTAAAQLVAKQWRDLGVDVHLQSGTAAAINQALFQGAWDAFPLLQITVLVPSQYLPFVSGPAPPLGTNFGNVQNKAYGQLSASAVVAPTEPAACKIWQDAERKLYAAADVVPMVSSPGTWWSAKTTAFQVTALDVIPTSIRMHQG